MLSGYEGQLDKKSEKSEVYETIAHAFNSAGVEPLFGVTGDANLRYVAAFIDASQGSYLGAPHEAGAVATAEGYILDVRSSRRGHGDPRAGSH